MMACSFRARLALALVLSIGFVPVASFAAEPVPQTALEAARATPQGQFVQGLGNRAIGILSNKSFNADAKSTEFRAMLRESFDLPTIARFVIGRSWNSATPEQQTAYMNLFESLVVKTYTDRFALYTGEGFGVRAVHAEGDRDFMVKSEISHPDGSPATSVNWRVRQKNDKLGIIDIIVEGVSMSVTQRQEYAAVLERNGGNIDALLDMMRKRVEDNKKTNASQQAKK